MNLSLAEFKPPIIGQTRDTSNPEGLDKTAAELSHRVAIDQLSCMYAISADDRDIDTMVSLFTRDAVFEQNGTEFRGKEGLREGFSQGLGGFELTLHVPTTHVVWFGDPGEAFGISVGLGNLVQDGEMIQNSFRYRDVYRLTGDRWQFRSRRLSSTFWHPIGRYVEREGAQR